MYIYILRLSLGQIDISCNSMKSVKSEFHQIYTVYEILQKKTPMKILKNLTKNLFKEIIIMQMTINSLIVK